MLEQYNDVIRIEDLCKILNIGKNTAYKVLQNGTIPSVRIGRKYVIPKCGVIKYLRNIQNINSKT